jgi:MFS family permease
VLLLCAIRFFPTVAWGAASLAIPLLIFRHSGSAATLGLYGTVSLLFAAAAQLATGRVLDWRAGRGASSARPLAAPLAGVLVTLAVGTAVFSGSLAALFVVGTLWAMAAWSLSTTMPSLIRELGGDVARARLVALTHMMWSAGNLAGTSGAGALIDWNPAAPFVLAAVALAVTLAAGLALAGAARTRPVPPVPPALPALAT